MRIETFKIGRFDVPLTAYLQDASDQLAISCRRPAFIVLPGGGYNHISVAEREPVALHFSSKGFQVFTLIYSVTDHAAMFQPQHELFETIFFIRNNAKRFCVDECKVFVLGFSAGGHLAATCGVHYNNPDVNPFDPTLSKPDAMALIYPCITAHGEFAYPGIAKFNGNGLNNPQLIDADKYVTADTPPTFLCHTADDQTVPVMNSLLFATALAQHKVPFELFVTKSGSHGMSLATIASQRPDCDTTAQNLAKRHRFSAWSDKCAEFLLDL